MIPTKKGKSAIKFLKIDNDKGYFSLEGGENWQLLDEISRDCLLSIVLKGMDEGFEMDDPESSDVKNKAHEIIYKKLYNKLKDLNDQRSRFKDESEALYKDAFVKYSSSS